MRLFIAINFPEDMKERLGAAVAPLRGKSYPIRWVRTEQIHVTVKFLGDVEATKVSAIEEGLGRALTGTQAFHLPVREFGAFPTVRRPRVLWVGCESLPVLELMYDAVEREMSALGFPSEVRPFRPHATIGRAERDAGRNAFHGLEPEMQRLTFFEEPHVAAVDVMLSVLGNGPPRYERLATVGLAS